MAVDAKSVKELREKTGLPMMDCKKALVETDGDVEKAYENLRKAGLKAVEKLAGREASDGRVGSVISADGKSGVLAALRCETEPVAKNEKFVALLEEMTQAIADQAPADTDALKAMSLPSGTTVAEGVTELVNQIRENINVGQFARLEGDSIAQYVHFDGKKAAMVAFEGGDAAKLAEVGKDVCMHIVFKEPMALDRSQLDPAVIEKEKEIQLAQMKADPKNAKKNDEILGKIIGGKMEKFVASLCLVEQAYVKDDKQTVAQYVESAGAKVKAFAYIATTQQ